MVRRGENRIDERLASFACGRPSINDPNLALADLGGPSSRPAWLQGQTCLPFNALSDDEFEVFCYLLLDREKLDGERVLYYGKTGDRGRDIVIVGADQTIEFVQCKHYSRSVGLNEVREELAKWCKYFYEGKLREKPERAYLYVSTDLTPSALDFMRNREAWKRACGDVLSRLEKRRPDTQITKFAQEWWLPVEHEIGARITERARRFPDLIKMFFELRAVVDTEEAAQLRRATQEFTEFVALAEHEKASRGFERILRETEQRNPGLSIAAKVTPNQRSFEIRPAPGAAALQYGRLTLISDRKGLRGVEKIEECLDTGKPVELSEGEFKWDSALDLSLLSPAEGRQTKFSIVPGVAPTVVPVRLVCRKNGKKVREIGFAESRLLARGRRSLEIGISRGELAGEIRLTQDTRKRTNTFVFTPDFCNFTASLALGTARFMACLVNNAELEIQPIGRERIRIKIPIERPATPEGFSIVVHVLETLCRLNEEFSIDIRLPATFTSEEVDELEFLRRAMRGGRVVEPNPRSEFTVNLTRQGGEVFVDHLGSSIPLTVTAHRTISFSIFGTDLPALELRSILEAIRPVTPVTDLQEALTHDWPEDGFSFQLRPGRITHEFPRWLERLDSAK